MSGFQVHFSSKDIYTPGDTVDALVAMNPAALATNLSDLRTGGILIVNSDAFESKGLEQAGYDANPLDDGSLKSYRLHPVDMTKLTRAAVEGLALSQKEKDRCRNFFAMGLVFWLYDRPLEPTLRYIDDKFGKKPEIAQANAAALKAGYHYGETVEAINTQFHVPKAKLPPGKYTSIIGNTSLAYGLMAAARLSGKRLFLGAYPITPGQRHSARAGPAQELRRAHVPGRRRNRGDDRDHRRRVRRRDGGHRQQRARHRAQGRRHGPGGDDRAADGHHQRAARRPIDRLADEDRAGRLVAGDVRPQRRVPDAGDRRQQPGRLLRRGSGSVADSPCVT